MGRKHAILLLAVWPLLAQWQTGRVRIHVTDPTGDVIPLAEVSLLGADSQPVRTAKTSNAGEIVWPDLPLGDYLFLVSMPGFTRRQVTVTIRNGEEQMIDVWLPIGSREIIDDTEVTVEPMPIVQPVWAMPPQALDTPPVQAPVSKAAKRKWWRIF
jgi:hypothetical protein